jgi:hypothetical protein
MFDPSSNIHRSRLFAARDRSRRDQEPFRLKLADMVRQYVGSHYHDEHDSGLINGDRKHVLLNLMFQTADIYTQTLVSQNPRGLVNTEFEELLPFAYRFQRAINNLAVEINLHHTLRQTVLDAFFTMGIVKVYNADAGKVLAGSNIDVDPGRPFAERISRKDIVYDSQATSWERVGFVQHQYYVDSEGLKDERFDQAVARKLQTSNRRPNDSEDSAAMISSQSDSDDGYRDAWLLSEFWLPHDGNQVVTWGEGRDEPLGVHRYDGPEHGPYHKLGFSDVPDNIEPVSPAMNLRGLHDLINSLARKLSNQARRQKSNIFYTGRNEDSVKRILGARDGQSIRVDDAQGVGVLNLEGIDQQNWSFMMSMLDQFNTQAGNPKGMAGLASSAGTLGQDKIIQENIGMRESKMQSRVAEFTEGILRDLGWHLWHDRFKAIPAEMDVDGGGRVDVSWQPDRRDGDFLEYNFSVEPFSMQYKSPQQRSQELDVVVMRQILPLMELIQQQGGQFDIQEYLTLKSELANMPRLKQLIKWGAPEAIERPGPEESRQSPVTERHNVRHNAGANPNNASVQQQMMSAGAGATGAQNVTSGTLAS